MSKKFQAIVGVLLFPFLWMLVGTIIWKCLLFVGVCNQTSESGIALSVFLSFFMVVISYVFYYTEDDE